MPGNQTQCEGDRELCRGIKYCDGIEYRVKGSNTVRGNGYHIRASNTKSGNRREDRVRRQGVEYCMKWFGSLGTCLNPMLMLPYSLPPVYVCMKVPVLKSR